MTPFDLFFLVRLHESHVIEFSLRPAARGIEAALIRVELESGQHAILTEDAVRALLAAGSDCAALQALWLKEMGRRVPSRVPKALKHVFIHGSSFASDVCADIARREKPLPELMPILESCGSPSRVTKVSAHLFLEGLISSVEQQVQRDEARVTGLLPDHDVDGEVCEEEDEYVVRWNRPLVFRAKNLTGALFYAALLGLRDRLKPDDERVSRVTRRLRSVTGRGRRSDLPGH